MGVSMGKEIRESQRDAVTTIKQSILHGGCEKIPTL